MKLSHLVTNFKVRSVVNSSFFKTLAMNYQIQPGGHYAPSDCKSSHQVAILVPYRHRAVQLKLFLQHIHPFLHAQQIEYTVVVVEQVDKFKFNRGKLFNVGFVEVLKKEPRICCFILHDVDLFPENQNHLYTCSKSPRHMCANLNTFRYNLLYRELFGGVIAIRRDQFKRINGFSNLYWGWGGEDDDLSDRITSSGLKITRWHSEISRFFMLPHKKEKANKEL